MLQDEWLIDGYNLLHYLRAQKAGALPDTPVKLAAALAGVASAKKVSIILVLDGAGHPEELSIHSAPNFRAEYSQKVSADSHIERHLFVHKLDRRLTVITDDRAISLIARGSGAQVLKNSQFLEMLREAGREQGERLFKEETRSHGFNRPFDEKLKRKGL